MEDNYGFSAEWGYRLARLENLLMELNRTGLHIPDILTV